MKPVGTFEWVTADSNMVLRKSDLVRTGAGSRGRDHVLRRHRGARAARQPDHHRGDLGGPVHQDAAGGLAHLLGRGELPDRAAATCPAAPTEFSTPTVQGHRGRDDGRRHPRGRVRRQRRPRLPGHRPRWRPRPASASSWAPARRSRSTPTGTAQAQGQALPARARAAGTAPPGRDHLPGSHPCHHAARLEAGARRGLLPRDARLQRLLQPAAGGPHGVARRASVELRALDTGKYYWRVAAVDKDSAEGAFSEFARFTVTRSPEARRRPASRRPSCIEALDVQGEHPAGQGPDRARRHGDGQRPARRRAERRLASTNSSRSSKAGPADGGASAPRALNGGVNEEKRSVVVVGCG